MHAGSVVTPFQCTLQLSDLQTKNLTITYQGQAHSCCYHSASITINSLMRLDQ